MADTTSVVLIQSKALVNFFQINQSITHQFPISLEMIENSPVKQCIIIKWMPRIGMQSEWIFDKLFVISHNDVLAIHRYLNLCLDFRTFCLTVLTIFVCTTLDRVCSVLILFAHMLRDQKKNPIQSDWHIHI